ncbi:MAG: AbgT family transporter [Pseudomonadota bacterium]
MSETTAGAPEPQRGFLGWIERTGNALPDPVFLFLYLIAGLAGISVIADLTGLSEILSDQILAGMPESQKARFGIGADGIISAQSLFSADNLRRLVVDMPETFAHFHPLGLVLTVMLGAGVAERAGLFGTAMRAAVGDAPKYLLTPLIGLIAMLGNLAADAAYVVLIPLAGIVFAAAGRHPIAGIAAGAAGVSGGFSANLIMGQLDALLLGITSEAAGILVADYPTNIAGNWYFIVAMTFLFLPIIWFVTDRIIEPKLGPYDPTRGDSGETVTQEREELTQGESRGLLYAGVAALVVAGLWVAMVFGPGTPLIEEAACPDAALAAGDCSYQARLTPFYNSLVAGFFVLFIACAWAYGACAGTIKGHRDVVEMMTGSMRDMGYYLVLAFVAAHFVAMFNWSNLGLIFAVKGANAIQASQLPIFAVLGVVVVFAAFLNLFVGSASAKWAFLAPVVVPMLMLLGVSPEMATAAYRVGDSATNIVTPLMVYFPLILTFAQRWERDFGLGSLMAVMIPYSIYMMISGLALVMVWAGLGLDLGPGVGVEYALPTAAAE